MTRLQRTCAVLLIIAGHAGLAAAQTIPDSFKDLQFLVAAGDRVEIVDATGTTIKGRISEMGTSSLSIASSDGIRQFREDDVTLIRQRKQDPVRNGMLLGTVMGATLGVVAELSCAEYCPKPGVMTFGAAIWGFGMGTVIDALHSAKRDVFRRGPDHASTSLTVAPVVGRRAAGAQVALRW